MNMIDYNLVKVCDSEKNIASISRDDFHYDCFLGDVIFVFNECDFSANWKWIPLMDFFYEVVEILDGIKEGETKHFEFTESESKIFFFMKDQETITVTTTYAQGEATVNLNKFTEEVKDAFTRLAKQLQELYPALEKHSYFQSMLSKIES